MTGVLVTRKKGLPLYCEFLLAGSGFFNVTSRARVTFQLLRCKGKIQLLMQDASVGTTHSVFFQTQKANRQFWFEWLLFPRNVNSLQANQEDWGLHGAHVPSATPCAAGQPGCGEKGTTLHFKKNIKKSQNHQLVYTGVNSLREDHKDLPCKGAVREAFEGLLLSFRSQGVAPKDGPSSGKGMCVKGLSGECQSGWMRLWADCYHGRCPCP